MSGERSVTMLGVDGSEWTLTARGADVILGVNPALWGTAPVNVASSERIGTPGSVFDGARHTARPLLLPLVISGDIEKQIEALVRATDPLRGDVSIVVERADGTSRVIDARYVAGLDALVIANTHSSVIRAALSFDALHPFWRSTTPTRVAVDPPPSVWDTGEPTAYDADLAYDAAIPYTGVAVGDLAYDDPIPYDAPVPYAGLASESATMTLTNTGSVDAWPTFTVHGACGRVSAANLSTGKSWRLPTPLASHQELVVVTRPGDASVRIGGQLALSSLSDGADLWGLPPGESLVSFEFSDRDASSAFKVFFEQEFLTC